MIEVSLSLIVLYVTNISPKTRFNWDVERTVVCLRLYIVGFRCVPWEDMDKDESPTTQICFNGGAKGRGTTSDRV